MVLLIIGLTLITIGIFLMFIAGKENIKNMIVPILIFLACNFISLYTKFIIGDEFFKELLFLPAIIFLLVLIFWLGTILKKLFTKSYNRRKIITVVFFFIFTIVILFIPHLTKDDKFKLFQQDYYDVSNAIFKAYDDGKVTIKEEFNLKYDLDTMLTIFPKNIVNKMKALNKYCDVYTYIVADKDVIYFCFSADFQSIDGYAVCRNYKDPTTDESIKSRFFDGRTIYTYIAEGVYYFHDGL
ncbi:hypothetical protein [Ruminiclostridium cellobioparum]|uniref:Uncharacterized protein n=1 Tax=Ruminiclostridium cellobioparum subsp. termitidis CT1112 TaxID=1195236 RepID=S0FMW0_RUMCE|nr:hypothetical protein [Ruminiclostridium cellobioparum]EMS70449.1 hypothetical protein CTER_3814 [Ruminiclostridium cellobioparum subsp. termitidis CT1112]